MDYDDILEEVTNKVNLARRIQHIVEGHEFRWLLKRSSIEDITRAFNFVSCCNIVGLHQWICDQKLKQRDYTRFTVKELRRFAAERKIVDYQWKSKLDLIVDLEEADVEALGTVVDTTYDIGDRI